MGIVTLPDWNGNEDNVSQFGMGRQPSLTLMVPSQLQEPRAVPSGESWM